MRLGSHPGFDRFVLQFSGSVPTYAVTRQGPTFRLSPKGTLVTLPGTAGLLVTIPHQDWIAYAGPQAVTSDLPVIRAALLVQNYEGVMQWGLGIQGWPCLRVFTLAAPARLVIDVAAT